MKKKYLVVGGRVISKNDGDVHYVNAKKVAHLYDVPLEECLLVEEDGPPLLSPRYYEEQLVEDYLVLKPDYSGKYLLPLTSEIYNEGDEDEWSVYREERRKKRWDNRDKSLEVLKQKGIEYEELNPSIAHYRVRGVSFWPTTGKYYNPKTGEKGRGVFNLIKYIKTL